MWIIIAYSLLTNHVLSYLSGAPFIAHLRLLPTTLLALKLIIKTNLVSWEITPTLAEEWHQLQVSHCALRMIHSSVLSFLLIRSATHSISWFFFFFCPITPTCPSLQMNVLQTGASTMCLLWTLDIHWMGAWTPLANSIVWLLVSSQKKMGSFFRFPSHSHRAICQLGYGWIRSLHSEAPFKLQRYFFAFRGNLRTSYDKKAVEGHLVLCDAM